MQKLDARRKNLLRKGSFLLALFLFQTCSNSIDSIGRPSESMQAWKIGFNLSFSFDLEGESFPTEIIYLLLKRIFCNFASRTYTGVIGSAKLEAVVEFFPSKWDTHFFFDLLICYDLQWINREGGLGRRLTKPAQMAGCHGAFTSDFLHKSLNMRG